MTVCIVSGTRGDHYKLKFIDLVHSGDLSNGVFDTSRTEALHFGRSQVLKTFYVDLFGNLTLFSRGYLHLLDELR